MGRGMHPRQQALHPRFAKGMIIKILQQHVPIEHCARHAILHAEFRLQRCLRLRAVGVRETRRGGP